MSDGGSGGGYGIQARGAAEGDAGGPAFAPGKGPTDRKDVLIAIGAIAAVAGAIALLVISG